MSNEAPPNPYSPPPEGGAAPQERLAFGIGATYWGLMFATLAISGAMVLGPWYLHRVDERRLGFLPMVFQRPPMGLGLLGCMAVGLRVRFLESVICIAWSERSYIRRHKLMRGQQLAFFGRSLAIGLLTTGTTLTAFVSCCVPIGFFTISYSPAGLHGNTQSPVVVAILVAVVAGASMIYLLLPRADLTEELR